MFEPRMRVLPEAADGLKACAQDSLAWLDGQLVGKTWMCGDRFTLADILLFSFLNFAGNVGQKINPDHSNVAAHFERCKERPSASAN